MNITNKYNLPETIVRAIVNDPYDKGNSDYSATELISPIQQTILKHRYWDEITEDASDRVWSLLGQCAHTVLERADVKDAVRERRAFSEMLGKKISGAADLYHDQIISDYKITTVWAAIKGNRISEWEAQLNILAYLFGKNGYPVKKLQVVAIYRDWSPTEAARYGDRYPPKAENISLSLWTKEKQMSFICERLTQLINNENKTDDDLPFCSNEEMWAKPDLWALKKKANQKATKLYDKQEDAQAALLTQKTPDEFEIQLRSGERTRCSKYCSASAFCSQYQVFMASTKQSGEAST